MSFSSSVKQAIDTGVVSSKARSEVVRVLRTLVLQQTHIPNHVQYETVCEKLVVKYAKLRDSMGSGWVSCFFF